MNRQERRTKKSMFEKELKYAIFDEFEDMTQLAADYGKFPNIGTMIGFWKNSLYSVQIYLRGDIKLIGIRRHDEKPKCPWSHKQKIKNIFISKDEYAIEVFPPESELTDQANMYWIWAGKNVNELCKSLGGLKTYKYK